MTDKPTRSPSNKKGRQRHEKRTRANKMIMETLLDTIPNPVFYKDRKGRYQGCNIAFAEQILGLPKSSIIGCTLFDLPQAIPGHLADVYAQQDAAMLENAGTQFYESEVQCADGIRRHFFFNKATFMDTNGKPAGIVSVMLDITERKQFEKSLRESENRLRFLSSKLLVAQEEERRRISLELHDDLGQGLAALKLQMLTMAQRLGKNRTELKMAYQSTLASIDRLINTTRRISRALSPTVIQDLKLCGTIRWMVRDFQKYAAIDTTLEMDDIDALFSYNHQIIIYRILQEALHNVYKHARARSVALTVRRNTRGVQIQIRDDGRGFDIDHAMNRHVAERGLGLAALEERSHMLGGQLTISSQKKRGTCVALTIPITGQKGENDGLHNHIGR